VVRLPASSGDAALALAAGLDRLRWLLAGELDVQILNLEPAFRDVLPASCGTVEDRAAVLRVLQPDDDPWLLLDKAVPERPSGLILKVRPTRAGRVPHYPIVFCHGMLAFSTLHM